ncbi:uncharacterized protein [Diabrotica undecimpunctata]|uniref:uncharacterized protein n=1 Tax=Diabrotica undecimpunctata TaxID=50387 RepID=UPI003B63C190
MFIAKCTVIFLCILQSQAKFYETDVGPYGYGRYSTHEYDPDVEYPYGLSYKRYPYQDIVVPKVVEYEGKVPGPIGLEYGSAGGLGYPAGYGKLGYGGYGHRPFVGAPVGISKGIGYGYGPGIGYSHIAPYGPGVLAHHGPYGISQVDKGIYSDGKQNVVGEHYNHLNGHNGESLNHGDAGYSAGEVALKDIKGDSAHFIDSDGLKTGHHEGKNFYGGEHFNTEGKHGNERTLNANHNKGHNIKGFKKSHHLDETGKTEEFYDQDHDEGGNYAFNGKFGKFGEGGGEAFKGGFNDGRFKSGEATKEGHYGNEYFQDKTQGNHGKFGGNKFAQNEQAYGLNKGFGEHGLTGHHENSRLYKNFPEYGYY